MSKKSERALAKRETKELEVPEHLSQGKGRGFEKVEAGDTLIPRIKLLQPLSPEVADKGMKAGTLFNSLSSKNYGSELIFIPVLHTKSRIKFIPREDGGGIECNAIDANTPNAPLIIKQGKKELVVKSCLECPNGKWEDETAPSCTLYYNFLALIIGDDAPVAISFSKTKIKAAKRLISLTRLAGNNMDMFAKKYILKTQLEKNSSGQSYFNYSIEPSAFVTAKEFKAAESLYLSLKGKDIKMHAEGEGE